MLVACTIHHRAVGAATLDQSLAECTEVQVNSTQRHSYEKKNPGRSVLQYKDKKTSETSL